MHDIKAIRDNPSGFDQALKRRGLPPIAAEILKRDKVLRDDQTQLQDVQAQRNELSKNIGIAKSQKDEARAKTLMAEVEALKLRLSHLSNAVGHEEQVIRDILAAIPNLPSDDVPEGRDETDNVLIKTYGDPAHLPAAKLEAPQDHVSLGEGLGLMDFEAAARISGARFVVLKGALARLERALGQFMLNLHTEENGYSEVSAPLIVKDAAAFGTGQLPKFKDDLFCLSYREDSEQDMIANAQKPRWLIPTAEVSLTNLVRESLLREEALPLRLTALTPCFRSEAGASGRDTRGMIRQHQFQKLELVSITTPEQSETEHERMLACAEKVLQVLDLPYRIMTLCTGDMGFSARKTYDIEVWLPAQKTYREISSCSNCGDFQARRMDARYRIFGEKGGRFVHTLNGSGLAVGRTLVAVLENYQDEGGRIVIPEVLRPLMGGMRHLEGLRHQQVKA